MQVRFTSVWNCHPLDESEFRDAIRDNYFSGKKFNFGLSEDQVYKLMTLFHTKRIPKNHPEINIWKYGDKQAEEDGRFDDHRMNRDGRFDDHRTDRDGRFDHRMDRDGRFDHRMDRDGRFDDHRTHLFRDRLGFISKEDSHGLDICKYLGDEDRVDDHVYRNANYVEEINNISCNRVQRNRSVTVERLQEDNRDRFLTNYIPQSDDFSDHSTRQPISGNHLDHSLGGFRRAADVNDVHDNLGEIRGIGNEDRFYMMEKMKAEHDIEDDRRIFTEPHGNHLGKIGATSSGEKFLIDGNRVQDEHRVINDFWQTMNDGRCFGYESEQGTSDKQDGTNDVWIKPNYDEVSTSRPRTYTEYEAGIKPRYYKDYGFGDVSPTNDSIRGVISTNYIGFSHCKQSTLNSDANPISEAQDSSLSEQFRHPSEFGNIGKTYDCGLPYSTCDARRITMPILYDSEASDIRLRPSSLAAGPSSSLVDDCFLYPSSKRASLSMSQVETAENVIKGHRSCSNSVSSGYDNSHLGEPRSEYIRRVSESSRASEKLFVSDAGLSSREDDPIRHGKVFRHPREDKRHDGSNYDKRVSVFSRLSSAREAVRHEQGFDSRERHENWDSSVNNVMEMLEEVVSGPIKRTGKSVSGFKQHDDDIVAGRVIDYELSKVKVEPDADSADETIEGGSGSILHETRLVDFKRRKKANRNVDDKSKEKNSGPIEFERPAGNTVSEPDVGSVETNPLIGMPCKRRRLVRPVFVRNENKNEPTVDAKNPPPISDEITPLKDDSDPTKAVESSEKVEASVDSVQVSGGCQKDAIEEASSEIGGDANAGNNQASDGNEREGSQEKRDVEDVSGVGSLKDNGKMCGWIEC